MLRQVMGARIKRIFHRKKGKSSEHSLQQSHSSAEEATTIPNLPTSLHDSAEARAPPRTGSDSKNSEVAQKPKFSIRHRGYNNHSKELPSLSTSDDLHSGTKASRITSRLLGHGPQFSEIIRSNSVTGTSKHDGSRERMAEPPQLENFPALSLEDRETHGRARPQSSCYGQLTSLGSYYENSDKHVDRSTRHGVQGTLAERYDPAQSIAGDSNRTVGSVSRTQQLRSVATTRGGRSNDMISSFSENSMPWKHHETSLRGHSSGLHPQSSNGTSPVRDSLATRDDRLHLENVEGNSRISKVLGRQWPVSIEPGAASVASGAMDRANSNSVDTDVIETVAPAVVHETVQHDIHHIRQEAITREIHEHDVYHRILPIIEVEVLPARHFLPVEGGGLVEVSANEVPGRGQSWFIAETASKIPSDEPAPKATSRFSAREFVGDEEDSKRYMTAEGHERTEETWIHPPKLETGGRDTGQTWPLVFSGDPPRKRSTGVGDTTTLQVKVQGLRK